MTVLNGNPTTVKMLATETANVQLLLHARVNGHAFNGGSGHAEFGRSTKPAKKKTRRVKPHMKNGYNQAALRAYGAVQLVQIGFPIDQACVCTGSHTNYVIAMQWIVANGDAGLFIRVLRGQVGIFDAAEQARPMVEIKAAYKKLTTEQRIAWAVEESPNVLFEQVIVPASAMQKKKTVTTESAITDVA